MPDLVSFHEPLFINTAGHTAGLLIFLYLLFLLSSGIRSRRYSRPILPAVAALLGLVWNGASLAALVHQRPDSLLTHVSAALGFAALSFLPAVLLSISLQGNARILARAGYAASCFAVCLHTAEAVRFDPELHRWGLLSITVAFSVLTVAATLYAASRRWRLTRVLAPMALLVFAISFVHFGEMHARSLWLEMLAHHAGIPLALFIVLQDFRFLLLDAFVRAAASAGLAILFLLPAALAVRHFDLQQFASLTPTIQAFSLTAVPLALVLFSGLRNRLQQGLTRYLFRRPNVSLALARVADGPASEVDEDGFLLFAAETIAGHVGAQRHELLAANPKEFTDVTYPQLVRAGVEDQAHPWAEAVVPLAAANGKPRVLLLGNRAGGRRYLSEDLQDLSHLAIATAAQLERRRTQRLEQLAVQAELRALQAQINPHFLFNAFNALYGAIPRTAEGARRAVLNLADIFRYFLDSGRQQIALAEELHIVKAYLEVEQLRLGHRLQTEIDVDPEALHISIPSLSIQPLVENAVKHGVATRSGPGKVSVTIVRTQLSLEVEVRDTGGGFDVGAVTAGVGLQNVRQRLRLAYGSDAGIRVQSAADGTTVSFSIPLANIDVREKVNAYINR